MSEILNELQEVKKASQEQTAASQAQTAEVAGKMAEIDEKVASAEQDFNQFMQDSDARYKGFRSIHFVVGGEWGKLYPVKIELSGGPVNTINVYRPDILENKGQINGLDPAVNPGTFTASIISVGDNWSHRVPFYAFDTYHQRENRFIGKVANHYRVQGLWLWLRGGGVGYRIIHDGVPLSDDSVVIHEVETDNPSGGVCVYLEGFNSPDRGIDYPPILESEIDASLPSSGYIRGISS
ncbi:hypothetical protein D0814_23235 [Vibrio parahaemolyticus]|nr:hypothetical protein [Vibrio parahaemolyticus]